jgi:hypothetical protein
MPTQPIPNTSKWTPSPNYLAQNTHILGASSIVLFCALQGWNFWIGLGIVLVWALIKEFVLDLFVIEHDTLEGSDLDFLMYVIGATIASVAIFHPIVGGIAFAVFLVLWTLKDMLNQDALPYD